MPVIQPTLEPARYVIKQDGQVILDGLTALGEVTGVNNELEAVYAEGDNAFLAAVSATVTDYNPLPAVGEWCEAGQIYSHNGALVICRQSHLRTIYEPSETPALFSVYRPDAGDLEWIANEPVTVGTRRTYGGLLYIAIQAHTTQADWTPDVTPALWQIVTETPSGDWQPYTAYGVGDQVTYGGVLYECIQAHTSLPGWEPPNVPALWRAAQTTDEWQPYTPYTIGDRVMYGGKLYECRQSHTSLPGWEPPNVPALWLLVEE